LGCLLLLSILSWLSLYCFSLFFILSHFNNHLLFLLLLGWFFILLLLLLFICFLLDPIVAKRALNDAPLELSPPRIPSDQAVPYHGLVDLRAAHHLNVLAHLLHVFGHLLLLQFAQVRDVCVAMRPRVLPEGGVVPFVPFS